VGVLARGPVLWHSGTEESFKPASVTEFRLDVLKCGSDEHQTARSEEQFGRGHVKTENQSLFVSNGHDNLSYH
jgi:hypothetical protein